MKKIIFLCSFIFRNLASQPSQWVSLFIFYITSFFIIGQLLLQQLEPQLIWVFYLFLQNFAVALLLKEAFQNDVISQRLQAINHQPLNLIYYLISTTLVYSSFIFIVQSSALPIVSYFFQLDIAVNIIQIVIWQACSALILTVTYLFGATLCQNNRAGVFFNLITVMPIIIPWFLISLEFLVKHNTQALLAVIALLLLLLPTMLYSQYLALRTIIRF